MRSKTCKWKLRFHYSFGFYGSFTATNACDILTRQAQKSTGVTKTLMKHLSRQTQCDSEPVFTIPGRIN